MIELFIEYWFGVGVFLVLLILNRPWDIIGWSRRKKLVMGVYGVGVNALLWPYLVAKLVWDELR